MLEYGDDDRGQGRSGFFPAARVGLRGYGSLTVSAHHQGGAKAGAFAPKTVGRLFLTLISILSLPTLSYAAATTAQIDKTYRNGDDTATIRHNGITDLTRPAPGTPALLTDYPSCKIFPPDPFKQGSVLCNKCCSEPDKILKNLFRGTDPLGRKDLDKWYVEDFWPPVEAHIVRITNEMTTQIRNETARIGGFMDAQNNMRAMSTLQENQAAAARTFLPSEQLCRFATLSKGLASSQSTSDLIRLSMSNRSFERQLLRKNVASGINEKGERIKGQSADKDARWDSYTKYFCNPIQNGMGKGADGICKTTSDAQYNADVDFTRSVWDKPTLDITVTGAASKDAQNITALADNLYASNLTSNMPTAAQLNPSLSENADNIRKYMLMRSVIAKRAIAENSFTSLVGMKAKGTPATAEATTNLLKELGMPEDAAKAFVTENPSYYAQMDALTRKMYQTPAFYTNLMESGTNVGRQSAAMKALELMQTRDIYKTMQRSEMLMATLLEIYVSREQGGLNKQGVQAR